ncbi:MAG: hypothetical protein Q9169_005588 [Polycauliona sp. 2 TL-2023]
MSRRPQRLTTHYHLLTFNGRGPSLAACRDQNGTFSKITNSSSLSMTAPYICVRCRYRVLQLAQRSRSRGFISLSQSNTQRDARQSDNALPTSENGNDSRPKSRSHKKTVKRTSIGPNPDTSAMDSVLEQLFTSKPSKHSAPTKTRYSGTIIPHVEPAIRVEPGIRPTRNPDGNAIRELSKLFYQDKIPLQEVWRSCERMLSTEASTRRMNDYLRPEPHSAKYLFRDILIAINHNRLLFLGKNDLPPTHTVIDLYGERAIMRYWWNYVLWPQLAELLKTLEAFNAPQQDHDRLTSEEQTVLLMKETMNVWSSFVRRYGPPAQPEIDLGKVPPPPVDNHAWLLALLPKHPKRPNFPTNATQRIVAACKLTHQILKEIEDVRKLAIPMTDHGRTFVRFVNRFVKGRTFSLAAASTALKQEGAQSETIGRWLRYSDGWGKKPIVYERSLLPSEAPASSPQSPPMQPEKIIEEEPPSCVSLELQEQQLERSIQATEDSLKDDHAGLPSNATTYRAATTIIKDLERAVDRFDVARVADIWKEYQRSLSSQDIEQRSREEIFIRFLSSFITLSRQEQAVHVWNEMLQCGVTPNQRHWNAMLHGACKARDILSIDEIWNGMLATGIEPDLVSWTTYISGLIMCKKDQRGLQTLNDLGRRWKQMSQKQKATGFPQDGSPTEGHSTLAKHDANKPSLAPVQAAISALLRIGKEELCWPLLEWAKSFSIPLTIGCLNVILRYAVRQGDAKLINRVFSVMDANNCSEDEQTYTILLNGHMSNIDSTFSDLSPKEQEISVLRILDDMTAKNVSIDQRTYGTILYGLLNPKSSRRNDQAARAVLDHMEKHKVKCSLHIHSILVTHYFSSSPPDLQAVENLWKRIKIERPILDREFYEKLVEGYAAARLVERMLFFLRRIPHEGKSPTWDCLCTVLNTLIQVGEWGLVKELIHDVKDRRSGLRRFADQGWRGGRSEEGFWVAVDNVKHRIEEQG